MGKWSKEKKKAFSEKMKAAQEAKQNTMADEVKKESEQNQPTENSVPSTETLPEPTTPPVASAESQQDPTIAAKLAELDEAIRKTNELNARLEKGEKERTEQFNAGIKQISPTEVLQVGERHLNKAQIMKKQLAEQPKVRVFVPLEGREKMGTQLPVTLNGYRVNIPKGRYVEVPEQIGEIIMDSLNQTNEAINNEFLIDSDANKQTALQ